VNTGKYNGWTNYPTWAAYLWLTNDYANEQALRAAATTWNLRDYVQEIIEQNHPTGLTNDLAHWALGLINWVELRTAILDH